MSALDVGQLKLCRKCLSITARAERGVWCCETLPCSGWRLSSDRCITETILTRSWHVLYWANMYTGLDAWASEEPRFLFKFCSSLVALPQLAWCRFPSLVPSSQGDGYCVVALPYLSNLMLSTYHFAFRTARVHGARVCAGR